MIILVAVLLVLIVLVGACYLLIWDRSTQPYPGSVRPFPADAEVLDEQRWCETNNGPTWCYRSVVLDVGEATVDQVERHYRDHADEVSVETAEQTWPSGAIQVTASTCTASCYVDD